MNIKPGDWFLNSNNRFWRKCHLIKNGTIYYKCYYEIDSKSMGSSWSLIDYRGDISRVLSDEEFHMEVL